MTGALLLGKNRLDDYATKYLSKHCKEALITPMPLPVERILKKENLKVKDVSLSPNLDVFGCCVLLDSDVPIYDRWTGEKKCIRYSKGTILIDSESINLYGAGAKRNTLIHEALHWEKDRKYFEILAIRSARDSEKLYPIMCRYKDTYFEPSGKQKTKGNEVKWLEWQANRLAPRVLMPCKTFKQKAYEFIDSYTNCGKKSALSCDKLIEDISNFFIVSRASAKYRLLEVGLQDVLKTFDDYDAVYADIKQRKEFVPLTPSEAFDLLQNNKTFQRWFRKDAFIFADGYFVLANPEYVEKKVGKWHLTKKAKGNLPSCVINIHEYHYVDYKNIKKDFEGYAILPRMSGVDKRLLTFHPHFQSNLKYDPKDLYDAFNNHLRNDNLDEENELRRMLGDPSKTLCQCLWFLFEQRGWHYPKTFCDETLLHVNYYGRIKNNKYNNMTTPVLMAICVGLKLRLRLIEEIFDQKSDNKLRDSREPDRTYMCILEELPRISIDDFNGILASRGLKELGTTMRDDMK